MKIDSRVHVENKVNVNISYETTNGVSSEVELCVWGAYSFMFDNFRQFQTKRLDSIQFTRYPITYTLELDNIAVFQPTDFFSLAMKCTYIIKYVSSYRRLPVLNLT